MINGFSKFLGFLAGMLVCVLIELGLDYMNIGEGLHSAIAFTFVGGIVALLLVSIAKDIKG